MTDLPDPARTDAGAALFGTWRVGGRVQLAMDAIAATWRCRPWPTSDLLAYSVFPGADGDTLLHFSQWTDEDAYAVFVAEHRDERNAEIDVAVPGIERIGLHRYRHHRSIPELPGTAASFTVETIERDVALPWADAALNRERPAGLLVAHAYLGRSGALVLRDWTQPPTGSVFARPLHLAPRGHWQQQFQAKGQSPKAVEQSAVTPYSIRAI